MTIVVSQKISISLDYRVTEISVQRRHTMPSAPEKISGIMTTTRPESSTYLQYPTRGNYVSIHFCLLTLLFFLMFCTQRLIRRSKDPTTANPIKTGTIRYCAGNIPLEGKMLLDSKRIMLGKEENGQKPHVN